MIESVLSQNEDWIDILKISDTYVCRCCFPLNKIQLKFTHGPPKYTCYYEAKEMH